MFIKILPYLYAHFITTINYSQVSEESPVCYYKTKPQNCLHAKENTNSLQQFLSYVEYFYGALYKSEIVSNLKSHFIVEQ